MRAIVLEIGGCVFFLTAMAEYRLLTLPALGDDRKLKQPASGLALKCLTGEFGGVNLLLMSRTAHACLLLLMFGVAVCGEAAGAAVTILAGGEPLVVDRAMVEEGRLLVPAEVLPKVNGFTLKPSGLCADALCIPIPKDAAWTREHEGIDYVDVSLVAAYLDQALTSNADGAVWSVGDVPRLQRSPLTAGKAPDFALEDRKGNMVRLSDFRGKKVLLLTWASW
jgi:hypothetical protein